MEQKKIVLPKGWKIDKVEGNEIILKEIKKELPKTWEECAKIISRVENISVYGIISEFESIGIATSSKAFIPKGLGKPMLALCQLLVCREIYRQGWKPDWDDDTAKYCITITYNAPTKHIAHNYNRTLSFQSEEVRDEFLENFEDLIEEAKELI